MLKVKTASGACYLVKDNGVFSKLGAGPAGQPVYRPVGQLFFGIFEQLHALAGADEATTKAKPLALLAVKENGLYRSTQVVQVERLAAEVGHQPALAVA